MNLTHYFLLSNLCDKNCNYNKDNLPKTLVFKDLYIELTNMQNYIDIVFNNTSINQGKKFYLHNTPKILVVMSIYNDEAFIKRASLSIQNQDLKKIEILILAITLKIIV